MGPAIEISGLSKKYPLVKRYRDLIFHPFLQEKMVALEDVSLSIGKGELFGLLGPNGAGKTTLLKILATLVLPDKGRVMVNGYDVEKKPAQVRRSMGFVVSEERSFYWRLTGRQNLDFFSSLNNIGRRMAPERIENVLGITGLSRDADRMFKDYSAGMKQRLAIARSLLPDPEILLMDEPTRSLDPSAARNMRDFVREELVARRGKTVCLSTHNLHEAEEICSRIAILHRGKILACDKPCRIKALIPSDGRIEIRLLKKETGDIDNVMGFCAGKGYVKPEISENGGEIRVLAEPANKGEGISLIVRDFSAAGYHVVSCTPVEKTLEEAFDMLTGE
jgi:ABC-2 type transport system ATP-binding protein